MSEPSDTEVAKQEDMRLDAQIDEYMEEKHRRRMEDQRTMPDDSEPEREPPSDWCPTCSGSGSIPIFLSTGEPEEMECPKCGGSG